MNIEAADDWDKPKWERETPSKFWDPGPKLLKSLRDYQHLKSSNSLTAALSSKICVIRHRFWSVVTGADIPLTCQIGGGLLIPHPNGIVIHPASKIGINCLIFQQVTLAGAVETGLHVDIGAGAKIIGPVTLGDHVQIGANAVVNKNIPSHKTAVGIPAKVINK